MMRKPPNDRFIEAKRYNLSDDALPLHPDFYKFVQRDERGYFIANKDGERWDIEITEQK